VRLLVVFLLFVTSLESYGDECPLKSTTLATDADLATFKASVINCDTVDGDLTLKGEALVDVQGLEGLREITGALKLHATNLYSIEGLSGLTSIGGTLSIGARGIGGTALQNLDPLSNLEVVGSVALFGNRQLIQINALSGITQTQDVWLYSNSALRDLEGLSGLTKIGGNLAIGSSSTLTSLDGLANVTEVNGAFTLEYSPLITNLDGLASLTSLGAGILIKENQTLRSIDGLQKLTTVPNSIVLFGLPALESFDGFSALTSVGGTFRMEFVGSVPNLQPLAQLSSVASIFLKNNDNLESVSALQNITSLDGFLRIDRNPKLTSLEGLENVASVSGNLDVNTNGNLSDCSSIATLLRSDGGILGAVSIYENKQGCNSVEEIIGTALICADAEGDCADSDLDGLTDYQERLLGTNPNFFDTDFDSISDGEEVEVGRDPLAPDYLIASGADVCIQDDQSIHCGYRTSVSFKGLADVFPAKKIDMTHMYGRTCVLSRAGEIACWGKDGGDPTFIGGGVYRELAAGERHTCGVNVAGEVECFGDNSFGQSTVPDLDDPVQITAGLRFTCAIDENQVKCWGASDQQANAPPATLNPRQLSSSSFHSCVLDDTGVQCWGANDYGQSNVPDLLNPRFIDAGRYETCALDDSGIVCWGRIAAKSRVYETGQVHRIAAEDSIAALTSDGFVFTTDLNPGNDVVISNLVFRDFDADGLADLKDPDDDNDSILDPDDPFPLNPALGQDSDGDGVDDSLDAFPNDPSESGDADGDGVGDNRDAFPNDPLEILDSDGDGVGDNGDAFPNNPNESSDLDKDGIGDNADPDDDGDGLSDVEEGALGSNPLSADTDVDGLRDNEEVERGTAVLYFDTDFDGISDGEEVEVGRNPLVADYLVSAGGGEACVQDDQGVSCGYFRRISYPGLSELFPLRDMGTAEYKGRMCAVSREGGEVRCWAKEGPGAATTSPFATFKPFDSGGFKEIAVGAAHVCGIKTDNTVICDGGATNDPPVMQSPKSITAGSEFTCAIDQGQVICWGVEEVAGAVPEGIVDAKQVSAALYHACALDANGVKCWGGNGYGQSDVPTDLQNPRYLDVGRYESCVLDDSGVRCWGRLSYLSRDFEAGTIHQLSRERTTVALKSTGFAIWEDGTQSNDQLIPEVIWSEGFESPVLNATNFPLYNGDWVNFGTPTPNFDTGSDAPVDTSFTGDSGSVWTVSLGNIDIANSSLFDAAEGSQSLNLNGHEQGAVQVTIDFPANGTYELEFALSKNPENVDTAEVAISLDGESVLGSPLSFSESVTREEMNYKLVRVRLQVDQSGDHVLELKSLNTGSPNGYGPVVDDLKIRQVIIFNDFDADGIKDLDDLDDDNDGTPDSEDAAPLDASVKKDSDGDGFDDLIDDFPFDATEWLDSDKDGTGDNSDPFPVDPKERSDVDGDGRGDNTDTDDDGDGLSDAREAELGSDPLNADTDGDGLVDGLELKLGTALLYSDSDFDGITDGEEVEVGRDPLAADYLVGSGVDVCIQDDRAIHCGYRSTLVFEGLQALFPAKTIDMTHMNGRTCVLSRAGEIACWGNDGGAATYIGDGTYVALAAGERHTCGINSASEVECFGDNSFGQSSVPALKNPTQITAGLRFTCAIDQGAVTCWGAGDQQANTPPITQNPRQISSSTYHSCVLDETGVQCWGANDYGQSNVPDLLNPKFVDAGRYETCALDDSGIVCWGRIVSKSRAYEKGEVYRFAAEDSIAALTSRGFVFTTDRNSVNDVLISDLVFRDFDGDGILDMQDLDDDNDGSPDKEDSAPLDPSIKADSDGDGFNDSEDAFPNDPSEWLDFDGDLIGDNADLDDDSDGLEDSKESLLGTNPFDSDTDADGVLDGADDFPLDQNWSVDLDGDGLNPMIDADDDGDGMLDIDEQACGSDPLDSGSLAADNDADGVPDCVDDDADGDGQADGDEFFCGSDPLDADSKASDFDRDRLPDCVDPDDDNDGVKDEFDYYPYDAAKSEFGGQRAIIVAGGGPYPGNFLWPATQRVADLSYAALKVQGLTDDDIVYLSEGDNPNIDGTPTKASVQNAIEKIEAEPLGEVSDLMIYLVDHGGEGVFKLTNTDLLTAEDLKTWLDSVQSSQEISAVVVYDACQSGSFVPLLATDGQLDRTVIASTGPKQSAVFGSQGKISFSYDFWTNILLGAPLSEAYNWASSSMFLRKKQVSLIDTNSNGIGNEGEDRKALSFKLFGEGNVLASDFPVVGEIQVLKELTGQTETQLRVDRVVGASAIVSVEAFVSGPDRYIQPPDEPIVDSVSFTLKVQDDGSWLGTLTGLEVIGDYEVSVIAENENGVLSHATEDSSNSVIINQKSGRAPILESDSDDDGLGDINDLDDDNDGVLDEADAYPLISLNGLTDSDNDGRPDDCDDACETLGMVADSDDDNDGVPDVDDAFPLDGTKSSEQGSNRFSFDVDESLKAEPLTDGLLVIRYLFGFSGDSLTSGAVSGGSNRDTPDAIASYLADADSQLDIDGDGESKPLTDGLLLIRYLFGFSGDSLVSGAIGTDATRNTAEEVEAYIKERVPAE